MSEPKYQQGDQSIDHKQNISDVLNTYGNKPLTIELTFYEITRIAQILSGRFDGKTIKDVDLLSIINSYIFAMRERNLNEIVEIQERRENSWQRADRLLYGYRNCQMCGQEFCICG